MVIMNWCFSGLIYNHCTKFEWYTKWREKHVYMYKSKQASLNWHLAILSNGLNQSGYFEPNNGNIYIQPFKMNRRWGWTLVHPLPFLLISTHICVSVLVFLDMILCSFYVIDECSLSCMSDFDEKFQQSTGHIWERYLKMTSERRNKLVWWYIIEVNGRHVSTRLVWQIHNKFYEKKWFDEDPR